MDIAAKYNMQQDIEQLLADRQELNTEAVDAFKRKLKHETAAHDASWHAEKMTYIPNGLRCTAGAGSTIFRTASAPNAAALFTLRYDMNVHFRRHPGLEKFDHRCSLCSGPPESNQHILFDCPATNLNPEDLDKLAHARQQLLLKFGESQVNQETYLIWLTSAVPRVSVTEANDIVAAAELLRKLRSTYYHRFNATQVRHRARDTHYQRTSQPLTSTDRIRILNATINSRSVEDFHAAQEGVSINTIRQWPERNSVPINPRKYLRLLEQFHRDAPYLLIANPRIRDQIVADRLGSSREVFLKRTRNLRNKAANIPWMAALPIWNFVSSTPLATAWTFLPRFTIGGQHHLLVAAPPGFLRRKNDSACNQLIKDIADDITRATREREIDVRKINTNGSTTPLLLLPDWSISNIRSKILYLKPLTGLRIKSNLSQRDRVLTTTRTILQAGRSTEQIIANIQHWFTTLITAPPNNVPQQQIVNDEDPTQEDN